MIVQRITSPDPDNWLCEMASNINNAILENKVDEYIALELPADMGKGRSTLLKLEEGLTVFITDCVLSKPVAFVRDRTERNDYYLFYFDMSQQSTIHEVKYTDLGKSQSLLHKEPADKRSAKAIQFYSSSISGRVIPPVGVEHLCIYVVMSKQWILDHMVQERLPMDHPVIMDILGDSTIFLHEDMLGTDVDLVREIIRGARPKFLEKMIIKANILRLISAMFDRMLNRRNVAIKGLDISDIERIIQAREILIQDFDRPPTIEELARHAIMSTTKFKKLFKKIFGMSCYQYFQKHRLERARALFDSGIIKVSEVAQEVGYHNLGFFSRVFKEYYHVTPRQYIQSL